MNINWRVRIKSKPFLMAVVAALLVFVYELAQLLGLQLPVAQEAVLNIISLFLTFLVTIGIVTDPTTPGMADSERASLYTVPGGTPEEQAFANKLK